MIQQIITTFIFFLMSFISFFVNCMDDFNPEIRNIIRNSWQLELKNDSLNKEKPFAKILAKKYFSDLSLFDEVITDEEKMKQKEIIPILVQYYKEQEKRLEIIKQDIEISPFGNINYGMTFEEMKSALYNKFIEMKKEGLIISKNKFEKICAFYYTEHHHKDLSRVWGADYLKNKIKEYDELHNKYDTPNYIIVADDISNIKIKLWCDVCFPIAGYVDNATIYFKRIDGNPVGCNEQVRRDIGKNSVINYIDISDRALDVTNYRQHQNVIQEESTGKCYIIDTEFGSFYVKIKGLKTTEALRYGAKKFEYFNRVSVIRRTEKPRARDFLEVDITLNE